MKSSTQILNKIFGRCFKVLMAILVVAFLLFSFMKIKSTYQLAAEILLPPALPIATVTSPPDYFDQNWDEETRNRFHFSSQGTQTLQMPYSWFTALPKPSAGLLGILGNPGEEKFSDTTYMARMGFIPAKVSKYNPDGLPVGIVKSLSIEINGLQGRHEAVGLTCAACHTSVLNSGGKLYGIDGGSANTDLGHLNKAVMSALGQTVLSAKLPILGGRFELFAKRVLGDQYSVLTRKQLKEDLFSLAKVASGAASAPVHVTEGYTRLDALNRIGNQVFGHDANRPENLAPIVAPVNFPHIWTSSWFDWVQYDGSIMGPLVRNVGEAMGVKASVNMVSPLFKGRFDSSIPVRNIVWIEEALSGEESPVGRSNSDPKQGLSAPSWPTEFGAIDTVLANHGKGLYNAKCSGCHLPALNEIDPNNEKIYREIWWKNSKDENVSTKEKYLRLNIIAQKKIGTDPAQGAVLATRTVNTAGTVDNNSLDNNRVDPWSVPLQLGASICSPTPNIDADKPFNYGELQEHRFKDGSDALFALALGAAVQRTIDAWGQHNYISEEEYLKANADRPNCLQAGKGYKARPLNGVWATPPFLHNGSVHSVWALLSDASERPVHLLLGQNEYDPKILGFT